MSQKNEVKVLIGGKTYTLSGFESDEYLQKVAGYINSKIEEFRKDEAFRRQPYDAQQMLIELNIADDYFKAKKAADSYTQEMEDKEKQMYDLKHDIIALQMKLDAANKEIEELKGDLSESRMTIVKLETELDNLK